GAGGQRWPEQHLDCGVVSELDLAVWWNVDQDAGREAIQNRADLVPLLFGLRPARRELAIEVSPVDRGGGMAGEDGQDLEVLLVERPAIESLGEIEVAQRPLTELDRHADQRLHHRMVRREAMRARIGRDVRDKQWLALFDEDLEQAVP